MSWWMIGAAANIVILVAYLAIAVAILVPLHKSRGWTENPLALATGCIFLTCAVHHGAHPVHMLLPLIGLEEHVGYAMREAFDEWHLSGWDIVTAGVATWYWTLRNRFPALVRGAAVFEDMKLRRSEALDIHDNIVQGLAVAKIAFELDRKEEGLDAVEKTLAASRKIITDILGDSADTALRPGELTRRSAAGKS